MKIILKGIIDRKRLVSNSIVIFLLFVAVSVLSLITGYQDELSRIEYEKEMYRTIAITLKNDDLSFIDKYKDVIEDKDAEVDLDGKTMVTILFKDMDSMYKFKRDNEDYLSESSVYVYGDNNVSMNRMFKVCIMAIIIALFILVFIFTLNYILNLKKSLSLFKILGFSKNKMIRLIAFILCILYSVLYAISYLVTYFIYYLLGILNVIVYYEIGVFEWKFLLVIAVAIIGSSISISVKKENDLTTISGE